MRCRYYFSKKTKALLYTKPPSFLDVEVMEPGGSDKNQLRITEDEIGDQKKIDRTYTILARNQWM